MLSITVGQIDDFQDGTTQNWTNGSVPNAPINTSGGRDGASDRILQISSGTYGGQSRLISYNIVQWVGNYTAAGVTAVSMDLKNSTPTDESIRIALRTTPGGPSTPGYASTNKFVLPADNAWHRALFSLDAGSLTAINSPPPLSTFLTAVGDFRILQADAAPALIGDAGNFQVGVDNIRAVGSPDLSFVESTVTHPEGNSGTTQFVYEVFLSGLGGATVAYATADGTATTADNDYVGTSGTLTFAPGQTSQLISVTVNGDTNVEPTENFLLNLSSPTNATIATPQATGVILADDAIVAGTRLFYKGSSKWNVTNGATFSDDNAIAPDKTAYLPGSGTSTFAAVSSYDKGINGLMVDITGAHGVITASDFIFKVGNNNSPSTWATATAPTTVTTRAGAGASGSDRVELMWANNAIQKQWLEVIVKGNDTLGGSNTNTALASSYVFFWGSAVGDSGAADAAAYSVTSADEISARSDPHGIGNPATRSNVNDFNRNGLVDSSDQIIARNNVTNLANQLKFLVVGAGGPFAPESSPVSNSDAGLASALAMMAPSPSPLKREVDPPTAASSASILRPKDEVNARDLETGLESEPEPEPGESDDALVADSAFPVKRSVADGGRKVLEE